MAHDMCRCGIFEFKIYQYGIDNIEYVQTVEPLRCVTLNTIIPLGIGILRNATQRKYFKWKSASNISQNDAVNVYLPLCVFISNTC